MKLDWNKLLLNLRSAGLTYKAISKACNIDAHIIGHLARYEVGEPKFSTAQSLLDLHYDYCRNKHNLKELSLA
jgi:hypothetical protein